MSEHFQKSSLFLLRAICLAELLIIIAIGAIGFGLLPQMATKEWTMANPPILQLAPGLPDRVISNEREIVAMEKRITKRLDRIYEQLADIQRRVNVEPTDVR